MSKERLDAKLVPEGVLSRWGWRGPGGVHRRESARSLMSFRTLAVVVRLAGVLLGGVIRWRRRRRERRRPRATCRSPRSVSWAPPPLPLFPAGVGQHAAATPAPIVTEPAELLPRRPVKPPTRRRPRPSPPPSGRRSPAATRAISCASTRFSRRTCWPSSSAARRPVSTPRCGRRWRMARPGPLRGAAGRPCCRQRRRPAPQWPGRRAGRDGVCTPHVPRLPLPSVRRRQRPGG